jgi:hypothetical protein
MDLSATGQTWRIQMTVEEYRQEVARRTADGESIEQIERELIEPAQLAQDDKDALWLYALGCVLAHDREDGRADQRRVSRVGSSRARLTAGGGDAGAQAPSPPGASVRVS